MTASGAVEIARQKRNAIVERHLRGPSLERAKPLRVAPHLRVDQDNLSGEEQATAIGQKNLLVVDPKNIGDRHEEAPGGGPEVGRLGTADRKPRPQRQDQKDRVQESCMIAGQDQRFPSRRQSLSMIDIETPLRARRKRHEKLQEPPDDEKWEPVDGRAHGRNAAAKSRPFSKSSGGNRASAPAWRRLARSSRRLRG